MCEDRIKKAAKSVDGVTMAYWSQKTKVLDVSFDESKTSVQKVLMVSMLKANKGYPAYGNSRKDWGARTNNYR